MYIKILNLYQNRHKKHTISCDSNLQTVDYSAISRLGNKSCSRLKSSCIHRSDHPTSTCYRLCCCPQWLYSRCIRWCQCRANIYSSSIIIVSTIGPPAMSRWQGWPNIAAVRATAFSTKSTCRRVASIWLALVSWIFKLLLGFVYGCHLTGHLCIYDIYYYTRKTFQTHVQFMNNVHLKSLSRPVHVMYAGVYDVGGWKSRFIMCNTIRVGECVRVCIYKVVNKN